jgi:hypothetical protein
VKWPDGQVRVGFTPAISNKALTRIRQTVRRWAFHRHSEWSLLGLAELINPSMRGWINYYGRFTRSALDPAFNHVNDRLAWWAFRKFKSLRRSREQASRWVDRLRLRQPSLFAHWLLPRTHGRTTGAV